LGTVVAGALPNTVLAGDPGIYRERVEAMLTHGLPYLVVPMEHFPGSLLPMIAAWLLGGFLGEGPYTVAFVVLMAVSLWVTGRCLMSFETVDGSLASDNFVVLVLPLLPLVVFRNDPWVVMLAVAALATSRLGRSSWWLLAGAILSKAWPVALLPLEWWRGRRRAAVITAAVTLAILVLVVRSPGFQATQRQGEIHAETVAGSLIGLTNAISGNDPGAIGALGAQLSVSSAVVALNALPGLAVLATTLTLLRRRSLDFRAPVVAGALTLGVTLALPAFSAQYLLWFAPFVACADRSARIKFLSASVLTFVLVINWFQVFEPSVAWWGLLVVRNALVVWLALAMARAAHRHA
jgi:hypothetical protein